MLVRAALLGVATLLLAGLAMRDAVSHIRGTRVPGWVASVAPANAAVFTRQFDQAMAAAQARRLPGSPCWECRAREVLRRDPLGPGPLRVLALYADQRGNEAGSTRLFTAAARLSRRDPVVQLWEIERAGEKRDVAGALEHYDQLLSVKPETGPLLYPRLLATLKNDEVRRHLAGFVRARKPWIKDFINHALLESKEPRRMMELFEEVDRGGPPSRDLRDSEAYLVSLLAARGDYEAALRQARRVAGKHSGILTDLGFSPRTMDPHFAPLLWNGGGNQGIAAQAYDNGIMRVEVSPGSSGLAFSRDVLLRPGRYRMRSTGKPVDGLARPEARWEIACVAPDAVRRLLTIPLGGSARLSAEGWFTVPSGCAATRLSFLAGASGTQEDSGLELNGFALVPASPASAG